MRTQGHKSPGRAISLRFSAGLMKKKGSIGDMSTIREGNVEGESRASSGIRTHKTSHTEFLNWITYGRDLSPDITEKQQRTCPVCDFIFQDRRNMLQHIPTCGKIGNGLYTCINCNNRVKIGRYHMNGCKEVHTDQNWLKRIISFRTSSKIIVDASETRTSDSEVIRASWERVELPCHGVVDPNALELESVETSSASTATAELVGDLAVYEMESNAEYAVNIYGGYQWVPRYEMDSITEPQELTGDSYVISELETQLELHGSHYEHSDRSSLPSQAEKPVQLVENIPSIDDVRIVEETKGVVFAQDESLKPSLRLDTGGFATVIRHANQDHTGDHASGVLSTGQQQRSDSVVSYSEFPSPLNSPVHQHENDIPVSPMENTPNSSLISRSSRFSSMSELLSDNTPMSSFSSAEAVSMYNGITTRVFEDKEVCFDPEDMDFEEISNDGHFAICAVDEIMYSDFDSEYTSFVEMLAPDQSTGVHLDFAETSVESDTMTDVSFTGSSDNLDVDQLIGDLAHHSENVSTSLLAVCVANTSSLNVSLTDISFHQSNMLIDSASPATTDSQQTYTTSSNESLSPEPHLRQLPKSKLRRPLSRSPAIRARARAGAVYKCTYGACTFEPTGKKEYHKRTFQRHQQKCPHSPFEREKKPCKCNFPGCNKGFSRSDGLNAHRIKVGHGAKIEFEVVDYDDDMRNVVGYS